jgi:hypothetical protein
MGENDGGGKVIDMGEKPMEPFVANTETGEHRKISELTREEQIRLLKEKATELRKEFVRSGQPVLEAAIDEVRSMQVRLNELGMYESHRILARIGVRAAWCVSGGMDMGTVTDHVLAGYRGVVAWHDSKVSGTGPVKGDVVAMVTRIINVGNTLYALLQKFEPMRGDVVRMLTALEECREVIMIESDELINGDGQA